MTYTDVAIPTNHRFNGRNITRTQYPRMGDAPWGGYVRLWDGDTLEDAYRPDFACHDRWGYGIGYYVGSLSIQPDGSPETFKAHPQAMPQYVTDLTGDVLCGDCAAAFFPTMGDDDSLYVALEINGEIGNGEPCRCDECGILIAGPDDDDTDDDDDGDAYPYVPYVPAPADAPYTSYHG